MPQGQFVTSPQNPVRRQNRRRAKLASPWFRQQVDRFVTLVNVDDCR